MCRDRGPWCRGDRGSRCVAIEDRGVAALEDRGVSRSRIAVCHARGSRIAVCRDAAIEDRGVAIEDRGVANNYKRPKFCPVRRSIYVALVPETRGLTRV